jgi:hypothetical protein
VTIDGQEIGVAATGSDHYIQIHQPDLVIQSIRLVIERAKQGNDSGHSRAL